MKLRIMVISDTHGNVDGIIREFKRKEEIDLLIHLGDYCKDALKLKEKLNIEVINVRGNCDLLDYNTPEEELIEIKGIKILITHGHRYNVKYTLNNIYYKAREVQANVVLFGHSHVPVSSTYDGIIFLNPGSSTLPRGGSKRSYGLLQIDEKVNVKLVGLE